MTKNKSAPVLIKPPREAFKTNAKRVSFGKKVWTLCNRLRALCKRLPTRVEIIRAGKKQKIPHNAINNHYYRWRKNQLAAKAIAKPKKRAVKPATRTVAAVVKPKPVSKPKPKVVKPVEAVFVAPVATVEALVDAAS